MPRDNKTYHPPKWLSVFILAGGFLFPLGLIFLAGGDFNFTNILLGSFALFSLIAVAELAMAKVIVSNEDILITGLLKKRTILIKGISNVKLESGQVFIQMDNQETVRMPDWFNHSRSLYTILNNRLRKRKDTV